MKLSDPSALRQHVYIEESADFLRLHTPNGDQYDITAELSGQIDRLVVRCVPLFRGVEVPQTLLDIDAENGNHLMLEGFQTGVVMSQAAER